MTDEEIKKEGAETGSSEEMPAIDSADLDPNFKFEIAQQPGGEHIRFCFACGTCTAICPVCAVDERYDPRKIIRMALLGMRKEVLSSDFIWLCSSCFSCHERCPQDVRITELIGAIRNIAVREGYVHPNLKGAVDFLEKFGRLLEVSDFENKVRQKVELAPLDLTVDEIKKVLEQTKIRDVIEESD